ncbi:hypothetical protein FN846DRAFT_905285 [Sphaerosporella brunnea]|uniref:Uncharacterized protein n=1 Tax=Sphaerosporella brunnea TaxID=1250544 RepID=A0A5J5F220_9PEZI|nr:hypothetical protein FN846DRAFT_905285 [Sphaerosporella brunnea]
MSQSSASTTSLTRSISATKTIERSHASTVVSSASPSETTMESSEYYPPGQSYNDGSGYAGAGTVNDNNGGGAGRSDAFMGNDVGAQIGVIAAVVVVAICLFIGLVVYYFQRKKQWEKEVKRRSALPPNAKLMVTKSGEVKLADRSSTASKVGLEELEKGGIKVPAIEGERKPNVFNMLLGKF